MDQEREIRLSIGELQQFWAFHGHDLLLHDPGGSGECLVRRGELIAPASVLDPVLERYRRWVDDVQHDDDLLLARVRLRGAERDRCVDLAREAGVAANHVHFGCSIMYGMPVMWGTGADAQAGPPLPEPPARQWDPPVVVGVLDTGCDPHPWFRDRPWFEAVPEELDADGDAGQDRQAGHGTFVSGVVLQHAPGAVIRASRVLSSLGFTDDCTVATGLRSLRRSAEARGERIGVVVLTAGCHTADDECPPILREELRNWPDTVVVAAAGNHAQARPFWPAALPSVVAVAATGADGAVAGFSNSGPWVDAAAPGVDVPSSFVRMAPGGDRRFGYARWSGTSFAAPQVAAAAANALRDGLNPNEARDLARRRYPFER
ncbi:S8 family serine peptidase [Saccharopolyspora shandongensis]|uniref:S8 family peptidase n=1 Tax=Saccharopolyspora shandongensis TaxID=418495 RepID=UPI0033CB28F9